MSLRPPTYQELQDLRQKAKHLRLEFELPLAVEALWPHLSNTDLMNASMEMDNPDYLFHEMPSGRPFMTVKTKMAGLIQHYFEFPYQWVLEKYFRVERIFEKGLFAYLSYGLVIEPVNAHCSRIGISFYYLTKVPDMISKPVLNAQLNKIKAIFTEVSERLPHAQGRVPAAGYMRPKQDFFQDIKNLSHRWSPLMPQSSVPEDVATYLYCAPERYVHHMRSTEVALYFELSPQDVLHFCLLASKEGWLIPRWAMLCTSCWGAKNQALEMKQVVNQYVCESCGHDYDTGIDKNLELVFSPAKALRETEQKNFCAGSPANTPQVSSQVYVWPEEQTSFSLNYSPGHYRLWCENKFVSLTLTSSTDPQRFSLDLACPPESLILSTHSELDLTNTGSGLYLLRLESLAFPQHIVTASQLYALSEFREMFADQIPALGIQFKTDPQTFLSIHVHFTEPVNTCVKDELLDLMGWNCRENRGAEIKTVGGQQYLNYLFTDMKDILACSENILTHFYEMQALYSDMPMGLSLMIYQSACDVFSQDDVAHFDIKAFQPDSSLLDQEQREQGVLLVDPDLFDSEIMRFWLDQLSQVQAELLEDSPESQWVRLRLVHLNRLHREKKSKKEFLPSLKPSV